MVIHSVHSFHFISSLISFIHSFHFIHSFIHSFFHSFIPFISLQQSCYLAIVLSGNRAIRQSCNPAIVQSGNQPARLARRANHASWRPRQAIQAGQPGLPGQPARPRHLRDTQTYVGTKNIDFPLVFQAKMVRNSCQLAWRPLHEPLRNR